MAPGNKLGDYEFQRDPRGIRISRPPVANLPPVTPLLYFTVTEPDRPPATFHIERISPGAEGGIDFHGYYTDKIALDGNIMYRSDLDGLEVTIQVVNVSKDMDARFGAFLELTGEGDPRWMIPGLFYRDNRPAGCTHVFPSFHEFSRDPKSFVSSHWSFRADRAATPVVCAWTYGTFAFFGTSEVFGQSPDHPEGAGMPSLYLAVDDGSPRLGGEFPHREGPVKYSFCNEDRTDAEETFLALPKKTPLVINFVIGMKEPDLHAYERVLRGVYTRNTRFHQIRARGSAEEAERQAHIGLLRWHYDQRSSVIYETASFDKHFGQRGTNFDRLHMHVGGPSGAMSAYVLLWGGRESGHETSIEAGASVLDKICSELSPAGTIFPVWTEEFGWSCSYGPEEGTAHSRTVAEACLYAIRAIRLEMRHNVARSNWMDAISATLNYAMAAQRSDGAFPSYYDLTTGRPVSFDGFAGAAWIPALVAGSSMLYRPHYREVLLSAGNYYMQMVQDEFVYGSIEDQPFVPSSDDAHWALIAFLSLYEFDRDAKWLAMAKKAADLALTWRFSYNVQFPKNSFAGLLGLKTRGGDVLSSASPVLTPNGLISYGEMVKLAAITGDKYYRDRAEDARIFASQLVARAESDLNARLGMTAGQVFHTDWAQPKGRMLMLSHANACALIRHAELTRRSLDIPLQVFEGQEESELALEMGAAPVLYSETTISSDRSETRTEIPKLPSFAAFSKLEPMAGIPGGALTTPVPSPGSVGPPSSAFNAMQTPLASPLLGGPATPAALNMPTPLGLPGFGPDDESQGEGGESGEIKYKIF